MPKSRKAKSLSLRRISYKADARMRRKIEAANRQRMYDRLNSIQYAISAPEPAQIGRAMMAAGLDNLHWCKFDWMH